MLNYEPLYKILKERRISFNELSKMIGNNSNTISRSIFSGNVNTSTLYKICNALNCSISDVIEWNDDSQTTSDLNKKVNVDWELVNKEVNNAGYNLTSLAKELVLSENTLTNAKRFNSKISRRNLESICKIINKDPSMFEVK